MVTLKDIAQASGVSIATVSYVINDGPRPVTAATRDRVLRAVDELGYHPNAAARGLMGKRTHTFGVVFPHIIEAPFDNAYFAPVLTGIIDAATERRQITMLFTGMSWEEAERSIPMFGDGRCDGFLFVAPPANSSLVSRLLDRKSKVVLLGTRAWNLRVSSVDSDNVKGALLATRHLIALGHRRIAMIQGHANSTSSPERTQGYRMALEEAGLEVDEALIISGRYHSEVSRGVAHNLLSGTIHSRPTAIFCAQDMIAAAAIEAAEGLGYRVPADLSVVGFDDLSYTSIIEPALTTIHQPLRQIGSTAASLLLDLIDGDACQPTEKLFDVHLVERASTAPPKP